MDDEEVAVDLPTFKSFMENRGYTAIDPTEGFDGWKLFHYECLGRIYKIKPGIFQSELAQCTKCFKTGPISLAMDETGWVYLTNGDTGHQTVLFEGEQINETQRQELTIKRPRRN